jgi:septum formation protein
LETIKFNSLGKYLSNAFKVDGYLITFDTIVYKDGMILGKPKDREEARRYLKILSGDLHYVYTGVVVGLKNEYIFDYEVTRVFFDELDDELIEWYLSTEEYRHVAGGYSIQGHAAPLIKHIEGCYYNVVGLPLNKLFRMMKNFGIKLIDYLEING